MNLEVISDQLLNEVAHEVDAQNPSLALLYYYSVFHVVEKNKLPTSYFTRLFELWPKVNVFLTKGQQVQLLEAMEAYAKSHNLQSDELLLTQAIGVAHGQVGESSAPLIPTVLPRRHSYQDHKTSLVNFVTVRRKSERAAGLLDHTQVANNHRSISRSEADCWFHLLMEHYKNALIASKNKYPAAPEAVFNCLQLYIALANRLRNVNDRTQEVRTIYVDILEQLAITNIHRTYFRQFDDSALLTWLRLLLKTIPLREQAVANPLHSTQHADALLSPPPHWQKNLKSLRNIREKFKRRANDTLNNIDAMQFDYRQRQSFELLQEDITREMKSFISELFTQSQELLGPPPCAYAVLGVGSVSRGDMTPYSDLECVLIVAQDISMPKDNDHTNENKPQESSEMTYFKTLLQLVEFQVFSLGESFDDHPGFHLDKECHPLIMQELIGQPSQIWQRYGLQRVSTDEDGDGLLALTLLRPTLVHGSENLFAAYCNFVKQDLTNEFEMRREKAKQFLANHKSKFESKPPVLPYEYSIKSELLSPLVYVVTDLALYHNINHSNIIEILFELQRRKIVSEELFSLCKDLFLKMYLLRVNLQMDEQNQTDIISPEKSHYSQQVDQWITDFKKNLQYLYSNIDTFLSTENPNQLKEDVCKQAYTVLEKASKATLKAKQNGINIVATQLKMIIPKLLLVDLASNFNQIGPLQKLAGVITDCDEIITKLSGRNWFKSALAGRGKNGRDKIDLIVESIQEFASQLHLGASVIAKNVVDEAKAKDFDDIKRKEAEIVEEILRSNVIIPDAQESTKIRVRQTASVKQRIQYLAPNAPVVTLIDPKWEIPYFDLVFESILHQGSLATIYLGSWQSRKVVIKSIEGRIQEHEYQILLREIQIISGLSHPSIVKFYGACVEKERMCLVMEYMEHRSLDQLLAEPQYAAQLTYDQKKRMAFQIAQGLQYLHQQNPKVLHRNLTLQNILVNRAGDVKLTGFGLSKTDDSAIATLGFSTAHNTIAQDKYLAPEMRLFGTVYSEKCDVYSLGVVLGELCQAGLSGQALTLGLLPPLFGELMEKCCANDPFDRFGLNEVMNLLSARSPSGDVYYERGKVLEGKGSLTAAYNSYQRAAQKGSFKALTNIGFFHMNGLAGFPRDVQRAHDLFLQAANHGHPRAMFNLAALLSKGYEGVPVDKSAAKHWLGKAADAGDADAKAMLRKK